MKNYYVLWSDEDGIYNIDGPLDSDELKSRLDEKWYGTVREFLDHVPMVTEGHFNERNAEGKLVVLRAEVVVPKPKDVVKTWELP